MSLTQRAEKTTLVSPNPAGDHLFVHLPLPREFETRFELRDLSGRKVKEALISSGEQSAYLDVSALDPGLYFYTIHAKGLLPQSGKVTIIR